MKSVFKILFAIILVVALSPAVNADEAQIPPDTSSAELNRIKNLEGRWTTKTSMFGKPERVYTEYQVTAGGSAVVERIFPGTPNEMISVYYDDNKGRLAMTHYCIMKNRPTLKLVSSSPDTIKMDVKKIEGKTRKDSSMGALAIHFKDKNHIVQTCSSNGKEKEKPMTMEWTRVR